MSFGNILRAGVCICSIAITICATPVITQIAQDTRDGTLNSVAVSPQGEIYVLGQFVGIAHVNPDGTLTTVAGRGTDASDGVPAINAKLVDPLRIVFDPSGNIVVSEASRVRRIDLTAGTITTIAGTVLNGFAGDGGAATSAQLNTPQGLAFDTSGNLFIADSGNQRVRRVDAQTGIITTVAGGWVNHYAGSIGSPTDVAFAPNGNLLIASPSLARVYQVDHTGAVSVFAGTGGSYYQVTGDGGPPYLATFCNPGNLKFDSHGSLFIADRELFNNQPDAEPCGGGVRRVDADTGMIETVIEDVPGKAPPGGILIDSIRDIAVATGNLYVATSFGTLYRITPIDLPIASPQPEFVTAVNAASFGTPGYSPGEIITFLGNYLGPSAPLSMTLGPDGRATTELGGVQLTMTGLPLPLLYVSAGQINAVIPYGSQVAPGNLSQLNLAGPYGPAYFGYKELAATPGIFSGAVINPDGSLNTKDNPAPQGAILVFYGTGLGQTTPPGVDGSFYTGTQVPVAVGKVSILFGGRSGQVLYAGQAPGLLAGVMQINAQLPMNLPGIVPVQLLVDGTSGAGPSPTMNVFVQQSTPLPVISSAAVGSNPWLVATVGLREIAITGTGFDLQAVAELYFNGNKLATLNRDPAIASSSSAFYTDVNFGGNPGLYEIDLVNPPNLRSGRYAIPVYSPTLPFIDTIYPAAPVASIGPQTITVNGVQFQPGLSLSVFYGSQPLGTFSGPQLANFSATSFSFVMDFIGNSGMYGLEVLNPDGQRSPRFTFSTQPGNLTPQVAAVSPTNPSASGVQAIIVTGANFLVGLSIDLFYNGGALAHLSGSQVTVSSGTSASLSFDFGGRAGSYGMELVNPGGQRSQRFAFTVQPVGAGPTITSIAPTSPVATLVEQQIAVTGSGFQPGASVDFFLNGAPFVSVSGAKVVLTSATSLIVSVNLQGMSGAFGIEVANPGNLRSGRFNFTVQLGAPPPFISTAVPRTPRPTAGYQDIQVIGTGFQPGLTAALTVAGYGTLTKLPYQILNVTATSFTLRIDFQGEMIDLLLQVTNPDGRSSFALELCACAN